MNMQMVREVAREKLKGYCRVCRECNGRACAGEMPGMGGVGTGSAFENNYDALAALRINLRTLHSAKEPNTQTSMFGHVLSAPILAAPMTGISMNAGGIMSEQEWSEAVVQGSLKAGMLAMVGDGPNPQMFASGLEAIKKAGGQGIPFIKPRNNEEVFRYIAMAEEAGAQAIGMDVDAAGIIPMTLAGQPVGPKTKDDLKKIISRTSLPFIVKGVMTSDEAEIAAEAGAAAVVVSNHGGRVLDYTPGTAEVLQEIAASVKDRVTILVDGGVRTGIDVLKMMALGADGVLVGRPLLMAAAGAGEEGISLVLETMAKELKQAMILTGCAKLEDINLDIIF